MHEYEHDKITETCFLCGQVEDTENHLTQDDLDFAASVYQLYKGEQRAGLLDEPEPELDIDFIRDEERGK